MTTTVQRFPPLTFVDDAAVGADMRALMRRHAGGVAVITTYHPADRLQPVGFTATSLVAVSLDPPMVSFQVSTTSRSGRAWTTAGYGLVHLLDESQAATAELFAAGGPHNFRDADWGRADHGLPELAGCLGWLLIPAEGRMTVADHLVVAATVRQVRMRDGAFHRLT